RQVDAHATTRMDRPLTAVIRPNQHRARLNLHSPGTKQHVRRNTPARKQVMLDAQTQEAITGEITLCFRPVKVRLQIFGKCKAETYGHGGYVVQLAKHDGDFTMATEKFFLPEIVKRNIATGFVQRARQLGAIHPANPAARRSHLDPLRATLEQLDP